MRSRAALLFIVPLLSLATAGAVGACAAVLGFDDTTLRTGDGSTPGDDGQVPNDSGADPDGHTLADGAPSRLTTNPSSIAVRRGGTATVAVDIERGGDVTGDITIELTNLPTGVTATKAMLAGTASTGSIKVTASATATLGSANASLVADGTSLPASPIPVLVEGPSGTLDTTFGAGAGFVSDSSKGSAASFYSVAVEADGKTLAGGSGGGTPGWFVRRFGPLGAAEPAFTNAQGTSLPTDGTLHAIAIDSKGNIVCVGTSGPIGQLTVARLTKSGAIDTGFGTSGIAKSADTALGSEGLGVAIAADDSIVVSGSRNTVAVTPNGILQRYKPNGARDTTFATTGLVDITSARLVGVTIDATGAISAGGTQTSSPTSFLITKRLATGAADPAFGTAGIATFGTSSEANGFARLSTGEFLFAGDRNNGYGVGVAKPDGTAIYDRLLSTTTPTSLYGIVGFDRVSYLVAGHSAAANGEARVERMLITGFPDQTFGMQAISLIEDGGPGNAFDVKLFALALQPDTRILAAGNRSTAGATLYRLWP